jgi:methylated-DNA-[protein]-cysteine S-methyltransferase
LIDKGLPVLTVGRGIDRELLREITYILLQLVPIGRVVSYGDLARILGVSPRLIGRFMAENENPVVTPCHRVVGSNGELRGYSRGGIEVKKKLLMLEGVGFKGDRVRREYFYDLEKFLLDP